MDENGIKSLVHVLDLENPDLWKWLTAQEQPPEGLEINPVFTALHDKVMNNLNTYSAPETRAMPGQPWVRGWDDIKKGRDGPIAGNQQLCDPPLNQVSYDAFLCMNKDMNFYYMVAICCPIPSQEMNKDW